MDQASTMANGWFWGQDARWRVACSHVPHVHSLAFSLRGPHRGRARWLQQRLGRRKRWIELFVDHDDHHDDVLLVPDVLLRWRRMRDVRRRGGPRDAHVPRSQRDRRPGVLRRSMRPACVRGLDGSAGDVPRRARVPLDLRGSPDHRSRRLRRVRAAVAAHRAGRNHHVLVGWTRAARRADACHLLPHAEPRARLSAARRGSSWARLLVQDRRVVGLRRWSDLQLRCGWGLRW